MLKRTQLLVCTTAATSFLGFSLHPPATAQITPQEFQMGRAREACIAQAQQQQLLFNSVVTTIPISNSSGQMIGSDVVMSVSRNGRVYDVSCSFDHASGSATIVDLPDRGQSGSTPLPTEGDFPGRGLAVGSVFGDERSVDASLTFNQTNNFSFSLSVPPGTGAQVNYTGRITRIRRPASGGSNSFVVEGRVQSFASSANGLQVTDVTGNCEIEVFDALVIASSCNTRLRDSGTRFEGLIQF
ncbi:MAG: hypothetical protein HC881_13330 [Leptolyngbyaceae cyanobacterium SL_7_1]|nr:hypothetical protein [Leptolyngbyaceae cyanobacterium SL_7_1]